MRSLRWIVPALVAVVAMLLVPGSATAATTYRDQVKGFEYSATPTVGKFAGTATGQLPGAFNATVVHDLLSPTVGDPVAITGGSFALYSFRTITGTFKAGGTITLLETLPNCGNEKYRVEGPLGLASGGSGNFTVTLTHLRTPVGGGCLTYGATVAGSLTLTS